MLVVVLHCEAKPPLASTRPSLSSTNRCWSRSVLRLPVKAQVPAMGSYSSALLKNEPQPDPPTPPTANTCPLFRSIVPLKTFGAPQARASLREPVTVQVPELGSKSSAVLTANPVVPPATISFPLPNNVALALATGPGRLPVKLQVPVEGL